MAASVDVAAVDIVQTAISVTVNVSRIDLFQNTTPVSVGVSRVDMVVAPPANVDVADVWMTQEVLPLPTPIDTYLALDGNWVAVVRKQLHGGTWV